MNEITEYILILKEFYNKHMICLHIIIQLATIQHRVQSR